MQSQAADGKTFLDDPSSLKALIDSMQEPDRAEYKSYGALSLESCFPGRRMVVYTLKAQIPIDIDVISFGELTVSWDMGPSFEATDRLGTSRYVCVPKRLRPRDVFLHVPQNFQLRYKGRQDTSNGISFVSHYAVLVKSRSKELHQVEGHTYATTLNRFRERFPDLKTRY